MYTEIVTLAVMFGCIPCIIHCWLYRGRWSTAAFFIGGFIFGIVRENIIALIPNMYTYPGHPLYIGAAPLMMGFGWSASFYASLCFAERIAQVFTPSLAEKPWEIPVLTGIIAGALSVVVETSAGASETLWWIWPPQAVRVFYEMPAIVPFGWAGAAFLFVLFFRWSMKKGETGRSAAIFMLVTIVAIVIHLIYTLGVRLIISAVLG
jgi:hypothetical protein